MRGEFQRQLAFSQHLVTHKIGQRDFAGGNQVQRLTICVAVLTAFFGSKQIFLKLGQLARATQTVGVDDVRRVALGIAMLLGLHIQHELRQSAVQAGNLTLHHCKARAGQFDAHFKI